MCIYIYIYIYIYTKYSHSPPYMLIRTFDAVSIWCERCFDNHSSFHSSHIRNAMSKVMALEPFGFQKM